MTPVLPTINALLNATAAVFLIWGYILIRRKRVQQHRRVMISAFFVSCTLLVCYLVYHAQVGSVPFPINGAIRTVYLGILATHTARAAAVPALAGTDGSHGPPPPTRSLGSTHLAVRQRYGRGGVSDAVPPVNLPPRAPS
jgi:hypothetical protein